MTGCFCGCDRTKDEDAPLTESALEPEPFPLAAELALAERELKRALKEGSRDGR